MEPESSEASPLPTDQESSKPPIEEQEKGDNIYVDYLQRILDKIKKSVVNFDDLPETLHEDVRKSAEELMKQLQPQLKENLQDQFDQMLPEFNTVEKLQELAKLKAQYRNHGPAWKHSGIAEVDYSMQADVSAKLLQPQYEELHSKVVATASELWRRHTQAEQRLKQLERDIDTLVADNFTQNDSTMS